MSVTVPLFDRQYEYVTEFSRLQHIADEIRAAKVISLDCETTSLDPMLGKIRLLSINTGWGIYVIDLFRTKHMGPIRDALNNPDLETGEGRSVIVGQNLKFDLKFLMHHYGITLWPMFDTYRASSILYNGMYFEHKLTTLYQREFEIFDHVVQMGASDWSAPILSVAQLEYAAEDVYYLPYLRETLRQKLFKKKLGQIALYEFQAIIPESSMELNGFGFDREKWLGLAKENKATSLKLSEELLSTLPHPKGQMPLFADVGVIFNLNSPAQIRESFAREGIFMEDTKKATMACAAAEYPVVEAFMKYREVKKRVSSFGFKWVKNIHPVTHRVHTSFYPYTGAGRYACLVAGSPVRTPGGMKPIEALRPGDRVWTHRGRWRKLLDTVRKGRRDVYSVRLGNGEILTCTDSHRFLSSDGTWISVEDINEHLKNLDGQGYESSRSFGLVSEAGIVSHEGYSQATRNNRAQCPTCSSAVHAKRGEKGAGRSALLEHEERSGKPDVGEEGHSTPQLEGGVRRRLRIFDVSAQRETSVCASCGDGGSAGAGRATTGSGSPSHRWGQKEQRLEQSGPDHACRSQGFALYAGKGLPVEVTEVYACGSAEVYDVAVEEDESYECCGVFSHNSSKPNLQQIPRLEDYRACFVAEDGWILLVCDYGQIELRLMAEITQDPIMLAVFAKGEDPHIRTASIVMGVDYDKVTKVQRQMAKAINFGLCLVPGTKVVTSRGSIAIEDVRVGDSVLTHRKRWRSVTACQRLRSEALIRITTRTGKVVESTPEHLWYCIFPAANGRSPFKGWVRADELTEDHYLVHVRGMKYSPKKRFFAEERVVSVERVAYSGEVFDLTVAEDHSFVANGLVTHNCYGIKPKKLVLYARANYGISMTLGEAERFWRAYFDTYKGMKEWHERQIALSERTNICRTPSGRLRYMKTGDFNAWYNCVDAKTEALTQRGWVPGFELKRDDVLLTKNPTSGLLEWQGMTDLKLFPNAKGRFIEFRSRSFSAITTPDHRWLVHNKNTGRDECRVSDKLSVHGDHRIHRTGEYSGPTVTLSNDFVELCGWFLTEGTFSSVPRKKTAARPLVQLYQSPRANAENVVRIDELLERLGCATGRYGPYEKRHIIKWCLDEAVSDELHKQFPQRTLTAEFLGKLDKAQASLLLDTMMAGDGHNGTKRSFCTGSKEQADAFQALCVLCGFASSVQERDMSKYKPKSDKLKNVPKQGICWYVTILKKTTVQVLKKHRMDFEGVVSVWCPIVPNTYFVARREGQVYITGNTPAQGGGADGLKNALFCVYKRLIPLREDVKMVHMVHDEIVLEVRDTPKIVETASMHLEKGMIEGMEPILRTVAIEADSSSGYNWASAK